ncbi:MAG: ABC transporter substrate-binding protein [Acidobacteria bacterium]|nr:ABC transporter substrate-binding protein [Acidobacteriota bacterium]
MSTLCRILCGLLLAVCVGGWPTAAQEAPQRIIPLAPALTEICFELDFGERVVGVTDFCRYPPAATHKPTVGGLLNPNLERIVALQPDLVLLVPEERPVGEQLARLGIASLEVPVYRIADTRTAMVTIAAALGDPARGERLARRFQAQLDRVARQAPVTDPPAVLMVVGRDAAELGNIYAAGHRTFLSELLALAGGRNACPTDIRYPDLSLEGIATMNPEVIIEFWSGVGLTVEQRRRLKADWLRLRQVRAVHAGRIYILDDAALTIPGPRIPAAVERIQQCLFGTAEAPETGSPPDRE